MTQPAPAAPAQAKLRNKWLVLVVLSIGNIMTTLDGSMVNVSYPALADAFNTDTSNILWATVAYWVTSVSLLLTMGWIGDVFGRGRVFTSGFVVFTVGVALSGLAVNFPLFLAARFIQAFGGAMVLSNLNAIITGSFPAEERGKALGVSAAIVGMGLTLGPLLGGVLLDLFDWRAVFLARAPLGLVGVVMAWKFVSRTVPGGARYKFDYIGALALFASMASVLLCINRGGKLGFTSPVVIACAVAAAVFVPFMVWTQMRSPRPILDFSLFKDRSYLFSLLSIQGHYMAYGAIILLAPFFFLDALEFSPTRMGLFISAFFVGRTVVGPMAGSL
ncbi:MAG: MFS transporter [SAR202 cluster bacterium]|nr:MFS transporter [SAR202 cluster bacterium]